MRAVVQRVSRAAVRVEGQVISQIGEGLLVLVGVRTDDGPEEVTWMAEKLAHLRIFPDREGRLNRSILETGGEMLLVSQFTLYGDARKGRRPSFDRAAGAQHAQPLYELLAGTLGSLGVPVRLGVFGAHMQVELVNDGPVTLLVDSPERFV